MRLRRVFADLPLAAGAVLPLPQGPAQHLVRVLRAKPGDALVMFNGRGGEFAARVESLRRNEVTVRVGEPHPVERESPLDTTLLQGIARGDKMDQILQKATELGVTRVIPVVTVHGNVRLDADAARRRQQHWQGVVIAACEQCGRNRVPEVGPAISLAAALAAVQASLRVLMVPDDGAPALQSLLATGSPESPCAIAFLVGPEGGLAPGEIQAARESGFVPCRLGPRVLRTETAALTVLAALQFNFGDLGAPR